MNYKYTIKKLHSGFILKGENGDEAAIENEKLSNKIIQGFDKAVEKILIDAKAGTELELIFSINPK